MRVDIWTDIVCPWCYIGKRRFERALAEFPRRDEVQVVHRSFQLNPGVPKGITSDRRAHLMSKYGWSERRPRQWTPTWSASRPPRASNITWLAA